jgi:hypothetical protein
MLKVDTQRWHQSPEMLREQAVTSRHPRSRERFMGLYEIVEILRQFAERPHCSLDLLVSRST